MDNIKTWTGLSLEESVRMTEDRDKWRKYVHGVSNPWIEDGQRTELTRCPNAPARTRTTGETDTNPERFLDGMGVGGKLWIG